MAIIDPSFENTIPTQKDGFSPLVISGSAHTEGNTTQTFVDIWGNIPTVHLCQINIVPFSYDSQNEQDDFLPLIHRLLAHNPIIFATPVYWYSMSGRMKNFWDRITDLMYHHKELGYKLRGKTALIAVSSSGGKPDGFEMPLDKTFAYLKMHYAGCWDYIFPLEKHAAHNAHQKTLALDQWHQLQKKLNHTPS